MTSKPSIVALGAMALIVLAGPALAQSIDLSPVQTLLQEQGINWELVDERQNGSPLELVFTGQLRDDQEAAVDHPAGIAMLAFGRKEHLALRLEGRFYNGGADESGALLLFGFNYLF